MELKSSKYSLKRSEHLKSRKTFELVFSQNNVVRTKSLKLLYAIEKAEEFSCAVAFVAPKRLHKLAVDRNRNKRLLHEAYRLNQNIIIDSIGTKPIKLSLLIMAQNKKTITFAEVSDNMIKGLTSLQEKILKTSSFL